MGDVALRRLERRARVGGEAEDEERWLVGRVRAGELTVGRLELASCCGHRAAARALRGMGVEPSPTSWITDARRWGTEPSVQAALFAARLALPVWNEAFPGDERPAGVTDVVARWLASARPEGRFDPDGPGVEGLGAGGDATWTLVEAEEAIELAQAEAEDAADFAASWGAQRAEDACVAAYYAARAAQAGARDRPGPGAVGAAPAGSARPPALGGGAPTLAVPRIWFRRRPARRGRARRPPSVVDDFLAALSRAARARRETDDVVRVAVDGLVAAWCLDAELRPAPREVASGPALGPALCALASA